MYVFCVVYKVSLFCKRLKVRYIKIKYEEDQMAQFTKKFVFLEVGWKSFVNIALKADSV